MKFAVKVYAGGLNIIDAQDECKVSLYARDSVYEYL